MVFVQVFLTATHLCIVMEFAPGGDMFEYVVKKNGLREDEARWFFQQLIVGLDYCHRMVRTLGPHGLATVHACTVARSPVKSARIFAASSSLAALSMQSVRCRFGIRYRSCWIVP